MDTNDQQAPISSTPAPAPTSKPPFRRLVVFVGKEALSA
jgi:hypothetical protein